MKFKRKILMLLCDAFLVNFAVFMAFFVRSDGLPQVLWTNYLFYGSIYTIIRICSLYVFGLYHRVWQYASIGELFATIKAVTAASIINIFLTFHVFALVDVSLNLMFLVWIFNIIFVGGSRLFVRVVRNRHINDNRHQKGKRILIVGAGDAGALVAKEFMNHYQGAMEVVGFIDDDLSKLNYKLLDKDILGVREDIPMVVKNHLIDEIVIAMPSVGGRVIRDIVNICHDVDVKVKILPGVFDLIEGNVQISQIRDVEVEDLLGRDPVKVDLESMSDYVKDHVVLVTGAGGSIGSELCRQLVKFSPKTLLLLDVCENNVYDIEMTLKNMTTVPVVPLVKDVKDSAGINQVFSKYKPTVIFHAAAHKHVPLMEANPEEAIKNNCMGTYTVAQAANIHGAERFVLVSTDKAVNPTSVMGASKRVAEMIVQHLNMVSKTNYVGVRFGNVLGSRGSVVPLFKKQIALGGPVTITDENMIRYFMTIPEAVQLIIQAGALAKGGEVFVLDMGEPVKIVDLAKTLIKLSGFEIERDIEIVVIGMRPGEKLYEELLLTEEIRNNRTKHERIFVDPPSQVSPELLEATFKSFLDGVLPNDQKETERWLQQFLPDFKIVTHAPIDSAGEVAAASDRN